MLLKLHEKPERGAEEEVRLRLMLQDLTDHNEALRRELQQREGVADEALEAELAEAYEALAEWQQERV